MLRFITRSLFALLAAMVVQPHTSSAQPASLLYEVGGHGLKKSSYLFGTFHLLTASFLDTLPVVKKKLKKCKAMVGEVAWDETLDGQGLSEAMHSDTTLAQLLTPTVYNLTDEWLQELSGIDLLFLNKMQPMVVNAMLMQCVYRKHVVPDVGTALDIYLQTLARKRRMKVLGLEDMQTQMAMLYTALPLKRQAQMLEDFVMNRDSSIQQLRNLLQLYRTADFDKLEALMYDDRYSQEEIKTLLTNRNAAWLKKLPFIMQDQPTFIAVGAMHLTGEDGLVKGLQKLGYTVRPVSLR